MINIALNKNDIRDELKKHTQKSIKNGLEYTYDPRFDILRVLLNPKADSVGESTEHGDFVVTRTNLGKPIKVEITGAKDNFDSETLSSLVGKKNTKKISQITEELSN